jgi:hypothetical protein
MPTPNEQDEEVYALLLSNKGRCKDLATYREEIIASEREEAADRWELLIYWAFPWGKYTLAELRARASEEQLKEIAEGRTAILSGQSASPTLSTFLARQIEWSARTFGAGRRTLGILKHIEKEISEAKAKPEDLTEWIDIIILAIDGYWRHGGTPETIMPDLTAKAETNYKRTYPMPTSEDEPSEHVRDAEPATPLQEARDRGERCHCGHCEVERDRELAAKDARAALLAEGKA